MTSQHGAQSEKCAKEFRELQTEQATAKTERHEMRAWVQDIRESAKSMSRDMADIKRFVYETKEDSNLKHKQHERDISADGHRLTDYITAHEKEHSSFSKSISTKIAMIWGLIVSIILGFLTLVWYTFRQGMGIGNG